MDAHRFDDLTRRLAGGWSRTADGVSRRRLLAALAAGTLSAALGGRKAAAACPPDQVNRRGMRCVCKATGRPAPTGGHCPCPAGQTRCGETCVDASSDKANCGGCGIPCDGGNPCTVDRCRSGSCVHTEVRCPASSDPCLVPRCDPAAGGCTTAPAPNGTRCSDDDACDGTETCQGGVCVPGSTVVCRPSDDCHDAGICDPRTGACSNPARADGAGCGANGICCEAVCCEAPTNADPTCAGACDFVCDPDYTRLNDACCPNANVCGTTCLPAPCDAAACLVCRPETGACVSTCTPPANATAACDAGRCGFVCDAGFKPCGDACIPIDRCCAPCGPCEICRAGVCGPVLVPSLCGPPGTTCGPLHDECGNTLDCGECTPPAVCGTGPHANQCV